MEASKSLGRKQERYRKSIFSTSDESSSLHASKKSDEFVFERNKVNQTLVMFRNLFAELLSEYKADQINHTKATNIALLQAAMFMQTKYQSVNSKKRIGHILGIEVGDRFMYRAELNVIGLHRQFSSGIDFIGKGEDSLATSIVVTGRYANARESSDSLVYIGHGGNPNVRSNVALHDQKLEGGNLALKNSMTAIIPVRVILKVLENSRNNNGHNFSFVYDGLYLVEKMTQDRGEFGKLVFKFVLKRILGQPSTHVAPKDEVMENADRSEQCADFMFRKRLKSKGCAAKKDVIVVNDISEGQEKFPIRVATTSTNGDRIPEDEVMENADRSEQCADFMFRKRFKSKGCAVKKDVIIVNDISEGQEKFPIRVATTSTNGDRMPQHFNYIVNVTYNDSLKHPMIHGCDCDEDGCVDCEKCACIVKNGGNMPYDRNKRLVSGLKSSIIYECGPSCKCSSSCINRVSQCGIQFRLEIFKTELKGWGVRARSFIPSGSFVCEYVGEVCCNKEARSRRKSDDCISIMGAGKGFIDATRYGNIGRFINHSCSPNLHIKDVLYDHNDKNLPHKMLFAARDIPSGKELSYDYNSCKAKVVNIGHNRCHCRSPDCVAQIYIQR